MVSASATSASGSRRPSGSRGVARIAHPADHLGAAAFPSALERGEAPHATDVEVVEESRPPGGHARRRCREAGIVVGRSDLGWGAVREVESRPGLAERRRRQVSDAGPAFAVHVRPQVRHALPDPEAFRPRSRGCRARRWRRTWWRRSAGAVRDRRARLPWRGARSRSPGRRKGRSGAFQSVPTRAVKRESASGHRR